MTFVTAPANTATVTLLRSMTIGRTTDFQESGEFRSKVINDELDKLVAYTQQLQDELKCCLRLSESDTPTTLNALSAKATRAGKVQAYDSDGQAIASTMTLAALEAGATAAAASAAAALVSENAASTSETAAETAKTAAEAAQVQAAAAAQGYQAVLPLAAGTHNIETTDAKTYYKVNASAGTVTINLPAIGANDGMFFVFEVENVDNAITVVRDGADYINDTDGNYSGLNAVDKVIRFISDDNTPDNWVTVAISSVPAASTTEPGLVELATNAEVAAGTDTTRAITSAAAAAQYSAITRTVNAQTGTTYTLVIGDAGDLVTMDNASANTLTIPPNSSVAFATGTQIDIYNKGAGVTSVTGGSGVTLNGVSTGTGALNAQYSAVTIIKVATDTWLMTGGHAAVA